MEKVRLNKSLEVSRFVLGMMRLKEWKMANDSLISFIKEILDLGIDTLDHADIYGNYSCEAIFGEALKKEPGLRKELKIVTKCGINMLSDKFPDRKVKHYDSGQKHIIESVDKSLDNLNTDYIDLLLIHRPDPLMNPEETANTLDILMNSGKVLNFGVSNFTPIQFEMLNKSMNHNLVCNQIEISPYNIEAFTSGNLDYLISNSVKAMAWSPLAGGKLINPDDEKSNRINKVLSKIAEERNIENIDQIIYSWILKHSARIIPVLGTGNIQRIKLAKQSLDISLTREEWFRIYEASLGHEVA